MIAFAALWPFLSVQCAIVFATKGNKIPSHRGAARVAPVRRKFPNPEPILPHQNWRTAGTARTRREQRTPLECPAQPLGPEASAYYRSWRHAIAPAVETIDDGDRAVVTRALNTRPA